QRRPFSSMTASGATGRRLWPTEGRTKPLVVLPKEAIDDVVPRRPKVCRDLADDTRQRADPDGSVTRHRDVMLPSLERRQPHVASCLPRRRVAEPGEGLDEYVAIDVSREPGHTAITSSRTKWRRTTLGALPSSKWQRTASRTSSRSVGRSSASVKMA